MKFVVRVSMLTPQRRPFGGFMKAVDIIDARDIDAALSIARLRQIRTRPGDVYVDTLTERVIKVCPTCKGAGCDIRPGHWNQECPRCNGSGS